MRTISKGIRKGNKHSYDDFGMTLASKNIEIPSKNKITEKVPFSNQVYDFSSIYGSQIYSERKLEYSFNIIARNKIELNIKKTQAIEWLMSISTKEDLYDDDIPDFYFLAECEDIDFKENYNTGILKCKFNAYPFKIARLEEGNDIWDSFNFELDYIQDTTYDVADTKDVTIINRSITEIEPTIITNSEIEVKKDNINYIFPSGEYKDSRFIFNKGENKLTLNGTGTISFKFRREVL